MTDKVIIHVVSPTSDRGDLWAEVQRQNALIYELREAVHAHAQTIERKEAVISEALREIQRLRIALRDFARQNCEVGLAVMRVTHRDLLAGARLENPDNLENRLKTAEWQAEEWRTQANQLTVANDQKATQIRALQAAISHIAAMAKRVARDAQ